MTLTVRQDPAGGEAINAASALPGAAGRVQLMLMAAAALLGLLAFSVQLRGLLKLLLNDDLRSVGLFVPLLVAWLSFRALRRSDWESGGNWWGLLPIMAAFLASGVDAGMLPRWQVGVTVLVNFLPAAMLLWLYLVGVVLLFGGLAPLRRALFPISLVLLLNPFPQSLQQLLDQPLQNAGATVARGFAGLVGVPLDGDLLHLMFSPQHGVFIAPGCDGLRGSLTLGLATLVAGHLYRLRPWVHAGYVAAAVLAAYMLNFLRLCIVVLFTAFSVHVVPGWIGYGENFDYFEGGALFLLTAGLFLNWPRRHPGLCTPRSQP